jgi:alpha-pyrone synthase
VARSGRAATSVTHLVTVSCTGFMAPGVDVALIEGLGLAATVQRTHVGYMGCHGALNGLRVARAFTGADPGACVLLCAVELCSLHYYSAGIREK